MRSIDINEVQPGMTLARTIINDSMIVVLAENTLLSAAHITRLNFLGIDKIYIKDSYDLDPQNLIVQSMLSRSHAFARDYESVLKSVEGLFRVTARTKEVPAAKMKSMVGATVLPMVKESGIIDYLYDLKHMSNSAYNHSLRVSILAGVLAKWLRYSEREIDDIILAGFLHDIGKTQGDQKTMEMNVENMTETEREIYMQHTLDGYHLLAENPDLSEGIKRTALQHHERIDGSGFPFNSYDLEIHVYAKIIAVADLYDNMTTEREGCLKQTPFSAMQRIRKEMFTDLDPKICMTFLLNVQQSFIGSSVLLSNMTRGVIIQYPNDYAGMPVVRLTGGEIVDLNLHTELSITEYNPAA